MKQPEDTKTVDMLENTPAKRGRKPLAATEPVTDVVDPQVAHEVTTAANELTVADLAVARSARIFTAIGRVQMAHFVETVSSRAMVETYEEAVRLFNEIKHLPVEIAPGKTEIISSLDQFCEVVIGKSARRCQQLVQNKNTIGAELFEQAEALGLRQKDYAAIRALPDNSKEAIRQAVESGDKGAVLDLLQEFGARVDAAKRDAEEAKQSADAKDRVIADKNERIDKLEEKLHLPWKPTPGSIAQTQSEQSRLKALQDATNEVVLGVLKLASVAGSICSGDDENEPGSEALQGAAADSVAHVIARIRDVVTERGLLLDIDADAFGARPAWLDAKA